jgi:hypothetical protein
MLAFLDIDPVPFGGSRLLWELNLAISYKALHAARKKKELFYLPAP